MKSLMRCLNLTIVFLMAFWGVAVANEWYESMESSGIDQSQSALKNISTNGSYTQNQNAQQAVSDMIESVNTERGVSNMSASRVVDVQEYDPEENGELEMGTSGGSPPPDDLPMASPAAVPAG